MDSVPVSASHRLLALGGFLGFCALLLLVVLTGMRLFVDPELVPAEPLRDVDFEPADVRLTATDLEEIPAGEVAWGVYRPGGLTGPLAEILRSVPEPESAPVDWNARFTPILEKLRAAKGGELADVLEELERLAVDQQIETEDLREWADDVRRTLRERGRAILPDLYRIDDDFSISVSEVTQEQWFAFLVARAKKSGKPTPTRYFPRYWRVPSGKRLVPRMYYENHHARPVTDIDAAAAIEFCNWIWEEQLGGNPDVVVDLPTNLEFTRAGRGSSYDNFPWGAHLGDAPAVLSQGLHDARDAGVVGRLENGLFGLIGNAAEWVHLVTAYDEGATRIAAAGWSYLDSARRPRGNIPDIWQTPFSADDVETRDWDSRLEHVGFRFVVRRAPHRPAFVPVDPGPVQFVLRDGPVAPPRRPDLEYRVADRLVLPPDDRLAPLPYSIAAMEITNRQYLAFLTEFAADESAENLERRYIPRTWYRKHPLRRTDAVFLGVHGDPAKLRLFEPGAENHPVRDIDILRAQAYAVWIGRKLGARARLPTAAEFIRAGRGDGDEPYPWGDDPDRLELVCDGRADDWDRAVSPFRFLGPDMDPIAGLCGNVLELVTAPGEDGGFWLAGGCYQFPPAACTLDDFIHYEWSHVQVPVRSPDDPTETYESKIDTKLETGFRLVIEEPGR